VPEASLCRLGADLRDPFKKQLSYKYIEKAVGALIGTISHCVSFGLKESLLSSLFCLISRP
jgi:hypothetical protein